MTIRSPIERQSFSAVSNLSPVLPLKNLRDILQTASARASEVRHRDVALVHLRGGVSHGIDPQGFRHHGSLQEASLEGPSENPTASGA
jgi:hypothetical protein